MTITMYIVVVYFCFCFSILFIYFLFPLIYLAFLAKVLGKDIPSILVPRW